MEDRKYYELLQASLDSRRCFCGGGKENGCVDCKELKNNSDFDEWYREAERRDHAWLDEYETSSLLRENGQPGITALTDEEFFTMLQKYMDIQRRGLSPEYADFYADFYEKLADLFCENVGALILFGNDEVQDRETLFKKLSNLFYEWMPKKLSTILQENGQEG